MSHTKRVYGIRWREIPWRFCINSTVHTQTILHHILRLIALLFVRVFGRYKTFTLVLPVLFCEWNYDSNWIFRNWKWFHIHIEIPISITCGFWFLRVFVCLIVRIWFVNQTKWHFVESSSYVIFDRAYLQDSLQAASLSYVKMLFLF